VTQFTELLARCKKDIAQLGGHEQLVAFLRLADELGRLDNVRAWLRLVDDAGGREALGQLLPFLT
jgi:hypothetical protein